MVITRHVELLTLAGIDYILFDYTNSVTYNDVVSIVLQTLDKFYQQGWDVPKIGFYTNTQSAATVRAVYNSFYMSSEYEHLWFRFDGDDRPVIVGVSTANGGASDQTSGELPTSDPLYQFFNFYEAQWPSSGVVNDDKGFPWLQWGTPVPNLNGNISVSVAQHSSESPYFSEPKARLFARDMTVRPFEKIGNWVKIFNGSGTTLLPMRKQTWFRISL